MTGSQRGTVAAIVLAAGASKRFSIGNKLAAEVAGKSLLDRTIGAAIESRVDTVSVVTSPQNIALLHKYHEEIDVLLNKKYAEGLSSSLRVGLQAQPPETAAVIVLLADMPFITADIINRLLDASAVGGGIVVPVRHGRRGNPVLWPSEYFPAMNKLTGDRGARKLLSRYADKVRELVVNDDAIFLDVDTYDDLGEAGLRAAVDDGA